MKEEITQYYNKLAEKYDEDRFSNTYGDYIDSQEKRVLMKYLNMEDIKNNLDIACGTGRFLEFAHYGADISHEMIKISKQKFPLKEFSLGDAESLPYDNSFFKNVISFHLFMHLDLEKLGKIITEVSRVTKKDGYFIFDVPSKKRRQLTGYKTDSWHGGNQIDLTKIKEITSNNWELVGFHGIVFFPIHRVPKSFRKIFTGLDNLLCNSMFKEFSSHLIFILKKK